MGTPSSSSSHLASLSPRQQQRLCASVLALADAQLASQPNVVALAAETEVAFGQWVVRLIVETRDHRITLDECAAISQQVDAAIEQLPELLTLSYQLEVSSPGLFRTLASQREADFYKGQPVALSAQVSLPFAQGVLCGADVLAGLWFVAPQAGASQQAFALADYPGFTVTLSPPVDWPEDDEDDPLDDPFGDHPADNGDNIPV